MSQEALQGFDLAPPLFLSCLHDTGLEPTHHPLVVVPTDTVPLECVMKGRTSSRLCIRMFWWSRFYRHLLFLLSRSPILLVMKDQTEVCPLSRGEVPLSAPLQGSVRFLRLPLPASLSAPLTRSFPWWERDGLIMFRFRTLMG